MSWRSKKVIKKVKVVRYNGGQKEIYRIKLTQKSEKRQKSIHIPVDNTFTVVDESHCQPSTYSSRKEKEALAWQALQPTLFKARVEEMSPSIHECSFCKCTDERIIFCIDCGPNAFYCSSCCDRVHSVVLFHSPCYWKNEMYAPYHSSDGVCLERPHHHIDCASAYSKEMIVFSASGHQHKAKVKFCTCEKEAVTLVRYRLWPSSPEAPRVAFQFELLEMALALQMDGHLSLQSFCSAIQKMRNGFPILLSSTEVKDLYRCLVGDSFHQFRHHRSSFFTPDSHVFEAGEKISECPVCNEPSAVSIISLDGNFGLVHKKSSGEGAALAKDDPFFLNQNEVDSFVTSYSHDKKKQKNNCSDFQAGNIIRSKKKTDKLDVTGIFGSVCQHDIPQKFMNLKHGERLAYPIFLLDKILGRNKDGSGDSKQFVMYDVACTLHRHLQRVNPELLSQLKLIVPVFHSFAHNLPCQLKFGQRFSEETGLNDGEGVERLWSYLRKFSTITKEMTIAGRHNLIVDALHHYTEGIKEKLGERLKRMMEKAKQVQQNSSEHILATEAKYSGKVQEWLQVFKNSCSKSGSEAETEKETFKSKLQILANERLYIKTLLKKYFHGQEMAKRISKQLASNSEKLKKCIHEYNVNFNEQLTFNDVSNPTQSFFSSDVHLKLNSEQIKACQSYCLYLQSLYQENLTKLEIDNLLKYIKRENDMLLSSIVESPQGSRYDLGRRHMLMMFKLRAEARWSRYLYSLDDFSTCTAESQVLSFLNLPQQTCLTSSDSLFGESSESTDSDDSDLELL